MIKRKGIDPMEAIRGICLDGCYYAAGAVEGNLRKKEILKIKRRYRSVVLDLLKLYAGDNPALKSRCSRCMELYMKGEKEANTLDPIGFD